MRKSQTREGRISILTPEHARLNLLQFLQSVESHTLDSDSYVMTERLKGGILCYTLRLRLRPPKQSLFNLVAGATGGGKH